MAGSAKYPHDPNHGFCVVCGSVWPCSRAELGQQATPRNPIARLVTMDDAETR